MGDGYTLGERVSILVETTVSSGMIAEAASAACEVFSAWVIVADIEDEV